MTAPKISVIVPAFNHEAYIVDALHSVLAQTLGDLELIVIDDASRDGTWDAIQSIRDPRLRAFRHKDNQGAHVTLNEGLGLASGDFLAILNSDDAFHPERLERLVGALGNSAPGLQRRGLHRQPWPARPRP
jgi:glycosyltransferase involved in cell wall biosynthesis